MKKRGKAQASMEYMLIVGLVFAILVPTVYVFYSYSIEVSDDVIQAKLEKIVNDVINNADKVYYLGEPSKATIKFDMPDKVFEVSITPDQKEISFKYGDPEQYKEVFGISKVKLKSYLVDEDITPGIKEVHLLARKDHVLMFTGNESFAKAYWCAYYTANQIIDKAKLVYNDQKHRALHFRFPVDCEGIVQDISIDDSKEVSVIVEVGDEIKDIIVDSSTPLSLIEVIPLTTADYDLMYASNKVNIVDPLCRDTDGDGYGTVMESTMCDPFFLWDCDDNLADDATQYTGPAVGLTAFDVHPSAFDICDGVDNNCNDLIDEGCGPTGEICDGVDNDGNTEIDEGCDDDNDDYCDSSLSYIAYSPDAAELAANPNLCTVGNDCEFDDDDNVYPGAPELCDGIDNDCDDPAKIEGSGEIYYEVIEATCGDGNDNDCDGMTDCDDDNCYVSADCPHYYVFVTSGVYPGNLGGLTGADALCQAEADAIPKLLGKTFKAWISDSTDIASQRLSHSVSSPYILTDDTTLIAFDWTDLTDGSIQNPLSKDANGASVSTTYVWTAVSNDGTLTSMGASQDWICNDWMSSDSAHRGLHGLSDSDVYWTSTLQTRICSEPNRLYCFEQPAPSYVFVTSGSYDGDLLAAAQSAGYTGINGLEAADYFCQEEASAAGLAGTFKAWISDDSTHASQRLNHADGDYLLTDGTLIANDWDDLVDGQLSANINKDADTNDVGSVNVWTDTDFDGKLIPNFNCNYWTSNDPTHFGKIGITSSSTFTWSYFSATDFTCDTPLHLYCMQQ
ncbi:DUF1554 domain-containing protein [candidate division KSB1 bacterium]